MLEMEVMVAGEERGDDVLVGGEEVMEGDREGVGR
jgi:hypothetical protein